MVGRAPSTNFNRKWQGPAERKPDTRSTVDVLLAKGGTTTCPKCGGLVAIAKAPSGLLASNGVRKGDPVYASHRVGGGRKSRHDDIRCVMAGEPLQARTE